MPLRYAVLSCACTCAGIAAWLALLAAPARAGFVETVVASNLNSPVSMAIAPDGRIFVCQQGGAVRVIKNDVLLTKPFYTPNTLANDEEGLLAVEFDPSFASNHYVYITYTATSPTRHDRLARVVANGDTALAGSEVTLFDFDDNVAHYHLGGAIHFGPDGKLYTTTGDNANGNNSQSMTTTFGKMFRLNADGTIPADNPFYLTASGKYRGIYGLGFRNAFTFAFQPGMSRLYINDVGGSSYEEVDLGVSGGNYGWPTYEGPTAVGGYQSPVHWYTHAEGCAITGGTFYNPASPTFPAQYVGKYFYAEYCNNQIRYIDPASPGTYTFFSNTLLPGPVDLRVGPDRNLYYLSRGNSGSDGGDNSSSGVVVKVSYSGNNSPAFSLHPANQTVTVGSTATFTVAASGAPPPSFQWQKNTVDIAGATSTSYTTPATVVGDNGAQFRCVATNNSGSVASNPATLTVTSNTPPTPTITAPASGAHYNAGTVLGFQGSATDTQDGALPVSALTWWIDFHHDAHNHPGLAPTTGIASGNYNIPNIGETSSNVWYRVYLKATDSGGLSTTIYRDVLPNLATFEVATQPPNMQVLLDGTPTATPLWVTGVTGLQRTLGVVSPQSSGGTSYAFTQWSDGGAASHTISTPPGFLNYTATHRATLADSAIVVNWAGDYVSVDSDVRDWGTPVQLNVNFGNGYTGARWHVPLSDTLPLTPAGSAHLTNWRFYGGIRMESYTNGFSYHYAEIWNRFTLDQLYYGGPNKTIGWDLRYWKKPDFLAQGASGTVTFGPGSRLECLNYAGGDGVPGNNSGRVRFVVKDGSQFYISKDSAGPSGVAGNFVLLDPANKLWAPYNPTAPFGINFNTGTAVWATRTFANITALGYLHSNDQVAPPANGARSGFTFERFRVTARVLGAADAPPVAGAPHGLELRLASSNPARRGMSLHYRLPARGNVSLSLHDVRGRRVALLEHGVREAGVHDLSWQAPGTLPDGIYFCTLSSGASRVTQRFVLFR